MGPAVATARGADGLITLDTSSIVALVQTGDPNHARTVAAFRADPGPHVVPASILAEVAYVLESRVGLQAVTAFLLDLDSGALAFDCGEGDFARIAELVLRYDDLPLGTADAGVIACAERRGARVLTLDRRHFDVVGREIDLEVLP